ncbi:MAG TPA: O-fucosyltransferase family protein [Pyrinomonadaceae bacterium]
MIYFENHCHGRTGLNNHVIPYTLCVAISNFLDRDFFFDHEIPTITLPTVTAGGPLKSQIQHLIGAERSLVSDLLDIPARRVREVERDAPGLRVDDPMLTFMTNKAQQQQFGSTMIWNFFSLGRTPLVREDIQAIDLIEFGPNSIINASFYFFLEREAKRRLLDSIRIRYRSEFESLAAKIVAALGRYSAIHVRLGDFQNVYGGDGWAVEPESFAAFLKVILKDSDLPLLVATDEFQRKDVFVKMLKGFRYEFVDEIILRDFFDGFRSLPFSDFNVLSVINQLICAGSQRFIGTCRSTFTSVIHRLRQERYGKTDFDFFPDARVRRHLGPDFQVVPDGQGFFEWNRYSAFAEHYEYPAWMREWNYELTAV